MPQTALFITWGQPVRGREKRANDQMRESVRYWERLQAEGRLERVDWAALPPRGGDLWGIALLRGTIEQIDSLRRTEEFGRWVVRLNLVADGVAVVDATVDKQLLDQSMRLFDDTVDEFERIR